MKRFVLAASILLITSFIISGCMGGTTAAQSTEEAVAATTLPTAEPTTEPTPAPIPCTIAFVSDRDGNREVYTMDSEGANLTNLTNLESDDFDPAWSPNGSQIAFVSNRPTENGGQFIYIMNADGSDVHQLTIESDSKFPDWSNDGKAITYASSGDIYVIKTDGSAPSVNLTNSSEVDTRPVWSNDGSQIAWLSGGDNNWNIFLMNTDGSNIQQLTENGKVSDVEWTVDGRLFTHYEEPGGICFNCVMNADGTDVIDAGGKGSIQEFLPYWTLSGDRVELVASDHLTGDNEVMLVGEIYPDIFKNLTNNPANDTDPDWPANCGPVADATAATSQETQETETTPDDGKIVIGYTGDRDDFQEADRKQACSELDVECREGSDITELVNQEVDVILYFSNRFNVMGDAMKIHDAAVERIPVVVVNAESSETYEPGVYNLSIDSDATETIFEWMFSEMGGSGEFVYFNVGNSSFHQELIEGILKSYPDIQAISIPAEYDGVAMSDEKIKALVEENPNIGAIWADEFVPNLFWALSGIESDKLPLIPCEAKQEVWAAWKQKIDSGSPIKCISTVAPAGMGFEGVYVAYYLASGLEINPDILGGVYGNTLQYEFPVVTNENLSDWMDKSVGFEMRNGQYKLPVMSPDEIRSTWFLE